MTELLLKFLVIIIIGYILYLSFATSNVRAKEGFTTPSSNNSSTSSTSSNGVAGNASAYDSQISSQITKIQDSLVSSTYNNTYKEILSSLNSYCDVLALNTLLNISQGEINNNDITPSLEKFNIYITASNNIQSMITNLV
jgi:hypothetical protein